MTAWEHIVANSTLAEDEGDAWEHLINPNGIGGGITYTGEINSISATKKVELIEVTTVNSLSEELSINITQADIIVEIQSVKDGDINGVC